MKILHPEFEHVTSLEEAEAVQNRLRDLVRLAPLRRPPHRVVGSDAAYSRDEIMGYAAAAALDLETLRTIEVQTARAACAFPYVPGLFSFREAPILLAALRLLTEAPDVILVEGHGIAHPRRAGLACHIGVALDLPTIGCAKTPLAGVWEPPPERAGAWSEVRLDGEAVGAVYRHRAQGKPVYVSPGHLIDLPSIHELLPRLFRDRHLPEPLALAHEASVKARGRH